MPSAIHKGGTVMTHLLPMDGQKLWTYLWLTGSSDLVSIQYWFKLISRSRLELVVYLLAIVDISDKYWLMHKWRTICELTWWWCLPDEALVGRYVAAFSSWLQCADNPFSVSLTALFVLQLYPGWVGCDYFSHFQLCNWLATVRPVTWSYVFKIVTFSKD